MNAEATRKVCALRARRRAALAGRLVLVAALLGLTAGAGETAMARLTLNPTTISFPAADPDSVPSIPALQNPVQVVVRVAGSPSTISQLTATANGNLVSGPNSIPIDRVSWTAQGPGFVSGTLSTAGPQPVGQWLGPTSATGNLSYRLQNSWSYAVGNYTQSVVYTLVAY